MCSHIVAVLLFAQKMLSKTDFPSVWNRQNLGPHDGNKSIKDLWLPAEKTSNSLKTSVTKESLTTLNQFVDKKEQFGLYWLLSNPAQVNIIHNEQIFQEFFH
jgi:hypothetical protein